MKQKFSELEKLLIKTAQARQNEKLDIAKLNVKRKDYSAEYVKESSDPQITKAKSGMKALHQSGYEEAAHLLRELNDLAIAKHSKLNLDNPAWTNALKLIELSGVGIDSETVKKINASFEGDQSALWALRDVYKGKGVVYDGGLADQIYEPEVAFYKLREYTYYSFIQEGSLNLLSNAVSKIAKMEVYKLPPDGR